jgi:geranylgeranyl transferase type-2 subunit beta
MSELPFLFRLAERLHAGAERLPPEVRTKCRDVVLSEQKSDGGWGGREGDSDLYYTSFAIRSLMMLNAFEGAPVDRSAEFLKANATALSNIVDLLSWLYSALAVGMVGGPMLIEDVGDEWSAGVATWLDAFRTSDGGFGKTVGATAGSTYHTFLALLCLDMLGRNVADAETIIAFFAGRQREDGGFVEIPQVKLSGVNPTAAALVGWSMLGEVPAEVRTAAAEYLESVIGDEGGFQANSRIPFSDGLSTFTGLLATQEAKLGPILDPKKAAAFVGELAAPDGGFYGAAWDRKVDVEYTFYGLGTLGLLAMS